MMRGGKIRAIPQTGAGSRRSVNEESLYKTLLAAVEDDVCLTIEEGSSFPLTSFQKTQKARGNKVLARTSTKQLFEICCWIMQGKDIEGMPRDGALISGPPGDGKSFASQYFMTKLVQQKDRHVIYENVEVKRVWVFRKDGICRSFDGPATFGKCPELQEYDTAYIFDASTSFSNSYEPLLCRAWLLFFSSTNKLTTKATRRGRLLELGFVTPSPEELRVAVQVLLNNSNIASIDTQWDLFGGRMRWTFDMTNYQVRNVLERAVHSFDVDKISAILLGLFDSTTVRDGNVPTSLFSTSLDPKLQAELSECEMLPSNVENDQKRMDALIRLYRENNLKWVLLGDGIFSMVADKYISTLNVVLKELSEATVNTRFGSLARHSLQSNAPELLAKGGEFRMRVLAPSHSCVPNSEETLKFDPMQLVPLTENAAKNVGNVLHNYNSKGTLHNLCGSFKGVHSIAPPAMSFQYTSSSGHSSDLETAAQMNEHALANDNGKSLTQAFVVPYQFHSTEVALKLDGKLVWDGCFEGSVLMPRMFDDQMNTTSGLAVAVDNDNEGLIVSEGEDVAEVSMISIDAAVKKNPPVTIKLGTRTYTVSLKRTIKSLQHTALCAPQRKRLTGVRQVVIGMPYSLWERPSDAATRMGLRTMSTLTGRTGGNGLSMMRGAVTSVPINCIVGGSSKTGLNWHWFWLGVVVGVDSRFH